MNARISVLYKWLIFFFLISCGYISEAQLSADFSATGSSGCAPIIVKYTDLSKGIPTKWKWDLGNGTISFLRNPSLTYFTPGQYNVKLVISNASGSDSITKTSFIDVHAKPVSAFSASDTTGCYPLLVKFTDASTAGSGEISGWQWDFGDGVISTVQSPEHIYKSAGKFNVSLRITNSFGCVISLTKKQYIQINTGVLAAFTTKTSNSCKAPANINFINNTKGDGVISYKWDFGDGSGSTVQAPSHVYTANGSYSVKLIAKNSTGCTDTLVVANSIILGNINADFTVPPTVCKSDVVNIKNTSKPLLPATVLWTFGDGTTSTDTIPVKKYSSPGTYVIKMVANFGACLDSVSKTIVVLDKPKVNFTSGDSVSCKVPFTVKFKANVTGAVSYSWDFGDGKASAAKDPSHTYLTAGKFNVKLVAKNAAGCTDSAFKPENIKVQFPEVTISHLPAKGCAPFSFDFVTNVISTQPAVSYKWDFGDGSASTLSKPTHTFALPGSYTVGVIITTAGGCRDTFTAVNGVTVGTRPVAKFTATPVNTCAYMPVVFTDLSTGKVDHWSWNFGDGGTAIEQNPKHLYEDTGYFTITLIAINNGCPDTLTLKNYIHISPPVAKFLVTFDCKTPLQRAFTDMSIGADTWLWDFGDGNTSDIPGPVHTYASAGNYTVKLTVTNLANGCSFTKLQPISVIAEKAKFTVSDSVICKGNMVNFKTVNINAASIAYYLWNFGDGTSSSSPVSVAHVYKSAGSYSVSLVITDLLGCKDTLVKPLYIRVDGPSAFFKSSVPGACLNSDITFIDSSFSDGMHDIKQWVWNYGDGKSETLSGPPFKHSYSSPGIYTVALKVVDSRGCADSIIKANALIISKPVANFKTNDSLSCPQKGVTFSNTSTGPGLAFVWDFGDGATSSLANPVHPYAAVGAYTVKLLITDMYGCTDSIRKAAYVKIVIPKAGISVSDSVGNCPPLIAVFTNTSTDIVSSSWDFGDGTTSQEKNPSHFYAIPGSYTVTLTVLAPGGCIDKAVQHILVKGPYGVFSYTNITGCNPLLTDFTSSTTNTTSIIWDFNDGSTIFTADSILSHEYNNPGIYLPKIILLDSAGCKVPVIGTDTITVYQAYADFSNTSATLCDSGTVKFIDKSTSNDLIISYAWDFGDGHVSDQKDPSYTYTSGGLFFTKLVVTTQSGCQDSARVAIPVKVVNSPKIAIDGIAGACVPATLRFSGKILVADTSRLTWKWDFGNGNVSIAQNPPAQTYPLPNSYVVGLTSTNSSGCATSVSKTIQAYPIPIVKINASPYLCSGNSDDLLATGAATYNWTPVTRLSCTDCANPVAKPDSSITYFVTGTSKDGCVATDSTLISVIYAFRLNVSEEDTLCRGSSTLLFAEGGDKYIWSPSTGLNDPTLARPTATPLETTTYRVIAADAADCFKDTGYVPVKVFPVPVVNAGADLTINVGKTAELLPTISSDVSEVTWSPTSGIFRNSYPGISVKPNESLEYTVDVANVGGCMARDRITVYVLCNNANIFIPNTFSPNEDGANDAFYPRGTGVFRVKMLRIFSRWGEVVFERSNFQANDVSLGWNGTFKGKKLPSDVFVYTMEVVCDNNTVLIYKGNIALVR